eukprot:scaffold2188_cov388-Prasinococcus_capsulatus_cf.AAC.3
MRLGDLFATMRRRAAVLAPKDVVAAGQDAAEAASAATAGLAPLRSERSAQPVDGSAKASRVPEAVGGAGDTPDAHDARAPSHTTFWLTRVLLLRWTAMIYLVAFSVAAWQNSGLLGPKV